MPIYEFICKNCGHVFEEVRSAQSSKDGYCPHCEAFTGDRIPSAAGGYKIKGSNSASVSPKGSGSFKSRK